MVRTRFAPSPTGFLHIGSLRTVLFTYLIAKSLGGQVILRLEDTDQKREVKGALESLLDILDWMGIKFDEGPHLGGEYGPYIQSQRLEIYKKYADELLDRGGAYRCFCSADRLAKMREDQQAKKLPPRYDRLCRELNENEIDKKLKNGESFVIRQKMPISGEIKVHDELRGDIVFRAKDLDDNVLIKSDGFPTYQFAVVVDDHLMDINHVTRADEWLPSFPKNHLLYQSFGWTPPKFIHYPVVLNKEGGKLSKRQGDVAVEDYRAKGYLPAALINFCALLGWHPKEEEEILSLDELEKKFRYEDLGTSPAIFDLDKLDYFNGYYIRHLPVKDLISLCRPYFESYWLSKNIKPGSRGNDEFLAKVVRLDQERLRKLSDIGELTEFFFTDDLSYQTDLLIWKKITLPEVKKNLDKVHELLEKIPETEWTNNSLAEGTMSYLTAEKLKIGDYLWPLRVALTGRSASPSPFDVAEVLGKERSLERVKQAINKIDN